MGSQIPLWVDSVEKVGSRSLKKIRLNDNAIFDLVCLPPQIDYGRLGLTRSHAMRSPASFSKDITYNAEKCCSAGEQTFSTVLVMSDKTQAEHNGSALPPIADMTADIDFCRKDQEETSARLPRAQQPV